ncbi:hypothetical protein HSR121_2382 [Halapricum desulfuricans]|uniref:Uncharacterized protein n=1 Tax=Halapricum desulfuricans TaxID=2841257 RepID=A0A897N666_9EURY|nr:hypothetical protein HSR121_2382 [Halapricum desulfuricans]
MGPHLVEQRGYLAFVFVTERRTGRLLPVAERRVENSCLVDFRGAIECALEELDPPETPTCPQCVGSFASESRSLAI